MMVGVLRFQKSFHTIQLLNCVCVCVRDRRAVVLLELLMLSTVPPHIANKHIRPVSEYWEAPWILGAISL